MTDDTASSVIPAQLRDWRFVLVKAGTKKAFEANWQTTANYSWNDLKLVRHLKAGGNYGVLPGEDHVVIETDIPELQELLENSFPPTFTQRSPGHGTKHFFYNGHSKIVPLFDKPTGKDKKNIGHVKCGGSFVVDSFAEIAEPTIPIHKTVRATAGFRILHRIVGNVIGTA